VSNDYLAVFLHRWTDGHGNYGLGESRQVTQHYPSTVIGVATRPSGEPIRHHNATDEYYDEVIREFIDHVEERADDVRWFVDDPLECDPDA